MTLRLDPRLHPYRSDLAAEHLQGRVEAQAFVPGRPMRVVSDIVRLHRAPGHDQPIDTELLFGEDFTVYEERDGWAWGQLATDGYVGYVPVPALGEPLAVATHRVAVLRTFVYSVADIKAPPVMLLSLNAQVAVEALHGDLARLAGGAGFVFARHLRAMGDHAADFVEVAARFVGTPYLWGGRSSLGLDCSALVQLSLQAAGIACPRDSDMQREDVGRTLGEDLGPDAEPRRGDLVFWRGHVGIIADDDLLLHASGHHMLTVTEPFAEARARIARAGLEVLAVRRLPRTRTDRAG